MESPSNFKPEQKELSDDTYIDNGESIEENKQQEKTTEKKQGESHINIKINKNLIDENSLKKNNLEKSINLFKLIINIIISFVLIGLNIIVPANYIYKWNMFFFMTLWSFWMNSFYIISVTIIDLLDYIIHYKCEIYNNFVRNFFLRIAYTFSISIVFLYWMLILLGDDFEYRSRSLFDTCTGFLFHGLIFIFLNFDVFTSIHVNKVNHKRDFIIITLICIAYYIILGFGKYMNLFQPYDFMRISNVRQIIGACGLIYLIIIDGFVVFNLIANNFFEQENKYKTDYIKNLYNEKMILKEKKKEDKTPDEQSNINVIEPKHIEKNENQIKQENLIKRENHSKIEENDKSTDKLNYIKIKKNGLIYNSLYKSKSTRIRKIRMNVVRDNNEKIKL